MLFRSETDRMIAFRSHWGYQSEYCNPAKGNEKGGVEGELGLFVKTRPGEEPRGEFCSEGERESAVETTA